MMTFGHDYFYLHVNKLIINQINWYSDAVSLKMKTKKKKETSRRRYFGNSISPKTELLTTAVRVPNL